MTVETNQVEKPGRIASLDVVRGLFLCVSVAVDAVLAPKPLQLIHVPWIGVHAIDLIFPLFVTLSGCGLAFAYRNAVGWRATARRSVVLFVAGMIFGFFIAQSVDPATMKFTGPLQIYSVLVLIIGVLHLWARSPRKWFMITLGLAAAQAAVLLVWQQHCPGGELSPACNPSRTIDFGLFGINHVYYLGAYGHDPEGLPSIFGALVTASAGVTAGHVALSKRHDRRLVLYLFGLAVVFVTAAGAAGLYLPTMKRLWTTPFALGVGALGIIILAIGMAVMDTPALAAFARQRQRWAWPLIALGRNSLLVYFGSHMVMLLLQQHGGDDPWANRVAEAVDVIGHPRASLIIVMVLAWAAVAAILHRRRIYLRP